jgi:hypothetical protein
VDDYDCLLLLISAAMQVGKSWLAAAVMLTACMAAVTVRGQPAGTETELASRVEMLVWETRFGGMSESAVRAKAKAPNQSPTGLAAFGTAARKAMIPQVHHDCTRKNWGKQDCECIAPRMRVVAAGSVPICAHTRVCMSKYGGCKCGGDGCGKPRREKA